MAGRRGFGTVRKGKSGRWQALYTHPETRRRVSAPTTFMTKADATRWLSTTEADLHRGEDLDPEGRSITFAAFSDKWLASKASLRPTTLELYAYLLRVHINPTLGQLPLTRINASTIREWNAQLRAGSLSDTSAAKAYRLLRQICQAAVDDRLIRDNPCRIKGASTERSKERQIPSIDDVIRLADTIEARYRAMVLIAAFAGLRKGECLGLARRHLNLESDPPTVAIERARVDTVAHGLVFQDPKTEAGIRKVALPASLAEDLGAHLECWVAPGPDALVFTEERSGDTPTKMVWRRAWAKASRAADVDCTFHDLRHVAGTLNAAAGATIKEAMARLGHASPVAALRYQHAVKERDSEIAAAVDGLLRRTP